MTWFSNLPDTIACIWEFNVNENSKKYKNIIVSCWKNRLKNKHKWLIHKNPCIINGKQIYEIEKNSNNIGKY
jgi:hypothetical protein